MPCYKTGMVFDHLLLLEMCFHSSQNCCIFPCYVKNYSIILIKLSIFFFICIRFFCFICCMKTTCITSMNFFSHLLHLLLYLTYPTILVALLVCVDQFVVFAYYFSILGIFIHHIFDFPQ